MSNAEARWRIAALAGGVAALILGVLLLARRPEDPGPPEKPLATLPHTQPAPPARPDLPAAVAPAPSGTDPRPPPAAERGPPPGRKTAVTAFVVPSGERERRPLASGEVIGAGDTLSFEVENRSGALRHAAIFALDARNAVYWLHPSGPDALSVPIPASGAPASLDDRRPIAGAAPGNLSLVCLLSAAPLRTRDVERRASHGGLDAVRALAPDAEIQVLRLLLRPAR